MAENVPRGTLAILDPSAPHNFAIPSKRINEGEDVQTWLTTYAYTEIMTFLLQLNASMFPRKISGSQEIQTWELESVNAVPSPTVLGLRMMVTKLEVMIDEAPPDPGPRRFGNISFRKWYEIVEERADELMELHVPQQVLQFGASGREGVSDAVPPKEELKKYLLGSFGSAQRLDYGTGHELSFLAFLGCIWKLSGFDAKSDSWGTEERGIVMGVIEPYLHLIRKLILTYTLEPAGSHGVWGLDDHSFLPYIFGSAQYSPAISTPADIPAEGSAPNAPGSTDVARSTAIERERKKNMYFSAIGFIHDVKRGPFWEHSPILFDISGVTKGWAKINKGMIKMYNAEVLSKFPVVQHFPFGSLFPWTQNPSAPIPIATTHTNAQPSAQPSFHGAREISAPKPPSSMRDIPGIKAPWSSDPNPGALTGPPTSWTGQSGAPGMPATKAPWATAPSTAGGGVPTRFRGPPPSGTGTPSRSPAPPAGVPTTTAPWVRKPPPPST